MPNLVRLIRKPFGLLRHRVRGGRFSYLRPGCDPPYIEPLCSFTRPHDILLGSGVLFLRGAVLIPDGPGSISIDDGCSIARFTVIQAVGGRVVIGKRCGVGDFCNLFGQGGLTLGDDVMIASGVRLMTSAHTFDDPDVPIAQQPSEDKPISIEEGVWIGANAVVLGGVTIGQGAVVGAGAVVTRSVPPFAVVAGVPARLLRYRPGHPSV